MLLRSIIAVLAFIAAQGSLSGCGQFPTHSSAKLQAAIDDSITSFIARQQMPGAVCYLGHRGAAPSQKAYGNLSYAADAAATGLDTIFDAASLTKVIATAPSIMLLIEQGKVALDAPLIQYFPECNNGGKETISIRHLLTHTSGLAAGIPATLPDGATWQGEAAALALACSQVVTHQPGTFFRYSDINFILLGQLVQRLSGQPLNEFSRQKIFTPLGMSHTGYLPLQRFASANIAPTFSDAQRGIVHDPTTRRIGGVAGHAGLFTTAGDLARYAEMMLNEGELNGVRILSRASVRLMTTVQSPPAAILPTGWKRSAGWDIDSPYARPRGSLFPRGDVHQPGSYGHTGFTGCILWIDPISKTFYVLLSNRVYPHPVSGKDGNILALYSVLGTRSAEAVGMNSRAIQIENITPANDQK